MSSKDMKTEPRFMTVIQSELKPACKMLSLDADVFAKAETVFIDRDTVSRILDYMSGHEIREEWYELVPDSLFVGTGLPVLTQAEGEYLGRMTGRDLSKKIAAKPFAADMEAYWIRKENLKRTDGTRGNGMTLGFGRCPGLRETSRYNARLFRNGEYKHPTPVDGNAMDIVSTLNRINEIYGEVGQCYDGMSKARTPLAPFAYFNGGVHETGLDVVANHCPYLNRTDISRIIDGMAEFPPKREVDRFLLAFTMTAFAFAANQLDEDVTERYETVEVKPPKNEMKRHSGKPKTTLLIHRKPEEPKPAPADTGATGEASWDTITGRVETITPDMARTMLGANTNNRNISRQQVELFARTMSQQAWQMNGEAIKFSDKGRLLDGQHRLLACVESGVPFRTLVIRGLPEGTQETMDAGKSRTMANVLELQGHGNARQLATTASVVCVCEQLGLEAACLKSMKPTRNEVTRFIDMHPELVGLAKRSSAFYAKSGHLLTPAIYSLLWWTFNEIDPDDCQRFFDMLSTGANLEAGSPVLVLRNTLSEINRRGVHSDYASRRRIAGLTVKAWNRWRDGETVKKLRFTPAESFPDAH